MCLSIPIYFLPHFSRIERKAGVSSFKGSPWQRTSAIVNEQTLHSPQLMLRSDEAWSVCFQIQPVVSACSGSRVVASFQIHRQESELSYCRIVFCCYRDYSVIRKTRNEKRQRVKKKEKKEMRTNLWCHNFIFQWMINK